MADILTWVERQFQKRFRDMGDGSHAEVVAIGGPGVAIGDVNMQVGDVDVSNANPVPVSDAGQSLTVDQATHDNLNLNANVQVGDADASAANPVPVSYSGNLSVLVPNGTEADQRLTVDATSGGVKLAALHADTTQIFWTCEDAQCRVTFDNSAPTATNGHIINPGDSGVWAKALATAAKFIRTGASSATIHASQMK